MASDEIGGYIFRGGYAVMLLGVIKSLGLRRVLMIVLGIVFFALVMALNAFDQFVSARRY